MEPTHAKDIKIFSTRTFNKNILIRDLNDFFNKNPDNIILDIKYAIASYSNGPYNGMEYSAIVFYKE